MSSPRCLVTGAGVRLGRAIALELAKAGYDLILHAHQSQASLVEVAREVQALGQQVWMEKADFTEVGEVDALIERLNAQHSSLDAIVHNAALWERQPFESISRDAYRRTQAINLEAPFFVTQGLLPSLRAAPAPAIVHVCDIVGDRPIPNAAHYAVSKAGLIMLTKTLALELAPHIRVNGVSPGTVLFPEDFDPETRALLLSRVPLARAGTVGDVARAVLFLLRDAPYVTGQVLSVDGGRSTRL